MLYIISYDLNAPGQNYEPLYRALRDISATRILDSQWAANRANTSCQGLFEYLWPHMDANDKLLVTAPSSWWASGGVAAPLKNMT